MPSNQVKKREAKPRSLLARGVDCLSRREHSRLELYRKLVRHLAEGETIDDVEEALDTLEKRGYLSNERYAQARVRMRADRYGNRRLKEELRLAGVSTKMAQEALEETADELTRAIRVWEKRFAKAPTDEKERAQQIRFLAARGFQYDVIEKVLNRSRRD